MSQDKEREAALLQTVEALRNYVDVIAKAGGGDKALFMAAMREADNKARAALAAIEPQDFSDLTGAQPCCGDYAHCHRACTPRGRWQATKDREDALASPPSREPLTEWDARGMLARLKCWHRLTEQEADELVQLAMQGGIHSRGEGEKA